MSKRRRGYPSETGVKRGDRVVRGAKELVEKLGRSDPCPCGSARSFQALLPAQRVLLTASTAITTSAERSARTPSGELPEWQGAGLLSQGRRRCRRGRSIRSLSAISPRGRSSGAEQPAFDRQARVRRPAPAPWSQFRRGVVEWPQTAGFDPVHTGSLNARSALDAPWARAEGRAQRAILSPLPPHQPLGSEAEQRSYKAKVDVCSHFVLGLRPVASQRPAASRQSEIVRGYQRRTSVAQRQEHDSPKVEAGGSSPPGRTNPITQRTAMEGGRP